MKALILDDSKTDAYVAGQVLKQFFETVVTVGTPADFHTALRDNDLPDFISVDVHIGDSHNGIAELARIKDQYTAASVIPIVVVTAATDPKLHAFALSNGADAVIVKPLTPEKLEPVLAKVLPESVKGFQK